MDKLKIDRLIIVEGRYDKIRLENIVDAPIIVVNGFRIYNDKKLKQTILSLARDRGVLILTDSDTAGYKIRVYLSKILSGCDVINVFAPEIKGKEKRKSSPSKQGLVGVEGTDDEILRSVLSEYTQVNSVKGGITTALLYELGYIGSKGAKEQKNALLEYLGVQKNISNTFLLRILNSHFTVKEFVDLKIKKN